MFRARCHAAVFGLFFCLTAHAAQTVPVAGAPVNEVRWFFEQITMGQVGEAGTGLAVTILDFDTLAKCNDALSKLQVYRFGVVTEIQTSTGTKPAFMGAAFSDCLKK